MRSYQAMQLYQRGPQTSEPPPLLLVPTGQSDRSLINGRERMRLVSVKTFPSLWVALPPSLQFPGLS